MSSETTEKARQRFSAYLDALQARPRQDVGGIGYHAYPQAMKVNIVTRAAPRFDAIVKLEELVLDEDGMVLPNINIFIIVLNFS